MWGEREPEPRLSAFDTAMVVVSLVIGIGIFRTPALVAASTGTTGSFLLAWAIGGAVSLVGALVFAEIGSRYPRAGGYYKVVAHCWHPMPAFLLNWSQVVMQGAGAAGVAVIGSAYLMRLGGRDPEGVGTAVFAVILIGALIALNAAGIRSGARAQNLLSVSKLVLIAILALAGLVIAPTAPTAPAATTATTAPPAPHEADGDPAVPVSGGPAGLLTAMVAVFYTYGGAQNSMNLAGDVRRSGRELALGIVSGMLSVSALYLAVNVAYVRALGPTGVASSPLVAADLARASLGGAAEAIVSLAIFLSAAGFVNATILHVPRSYLAMANDKLLPPALGRLDARTGAQGPGLALFAATALLPLAFLGAFEKLLAYVIFTDALSLVAVTSCLFVLRRRGEGGESAWRMPGYPWLPAAFALSVLGVALDILVRQTLLALAGAAVVAVGIPIYFVMRRTWR